MLVRAGDQILVDKMATPNRWDVIVFRYPKDPTTNYVKRLVGLPGERLELVGGDVFIGGRRVHKAPGQAEDMWLPLYDSACMPQGIAADTPRWARAEKRSHWQQSGGGWSFAARGDGEESLRFVGRITDELAYNAVGREGRAETAPINAGDVKIECRLGAFSGEGRLRLFCEFGGRQTEASFSAAGEVELAAETASVVMDRRANARPASTTARGKLAGPLQAGSRLVFAFRDGQAYVGDDSGVAASLLVSPEDVETARRDFETRTGPCRIGIAAGRCHVVLDKISLWKDVYYRNLSEMMVRDTAVAHPAGEFAIGPAEQYVMGDNSAMSSDSRFWGCVPCSNVIGIARWRYWPPARWHEFR